MVLPIVIGVGVTLVALGVSERRTNNHDMCTNYSCGPDYVREPDTAGFLRRCSTAGIIWADSSII